MDPETGVLRNLLGITSQEELDTAEADITTVVLAGLSENPIRGSFDVAHLQAVHRALFGVLYSWAGDLRTVEITKGKTRFASPRFLAESAEALFADLGCEHSLRSLNRPKFVERLAHYYSEVNILHPFREGNGRTQRAFFTLLAHESRHRIRWEFLDGQENLEASIAAYVGDESGLVEMFERLVTTDGK